MNFQGTESYIASQDLQIAVNAAIKLEKPLLVKGEPGTGKTRLAEELAASLALPLISWSIKSTTKAQQGLYEYDAVSRLRDSQLGDLRVKQISNYILKGKIWQAFESNTRVVLLIDEIDKADIEFPNDLLLELDKMQFHVYETDQVIKAKQRPVIVITSNNEKELPPAFLRRCFFHYIQFPNNETLRQIIAAHFPSLSSQLLEGAIQCFRSIREMSDLKKKPSTSELIDWIQLLILDNVSVRQLQQTVKSTELPPHHGALLKHEQDIDIFRQLSGLFGR